MSRRATTLRKAAAPAHNNAKASAAPAIFRTFAGPEPASCNGRKVLNNAANAPMPAPQAAARAMLQVRGLSGDMNSEGMGIFIDRGPF